MKSSRTGARTGARTVGIAIDEETRHALDEVVAHYSGGNRSEFLRLAVRDYQARLHLQRIHQLRERFREEAGGTRLTEDQVMTLIKSQLEPTDVHTA